MGEIICRVVFDNCHRKATYSESIIKMIEDSGYFIIQRKETSDYLEFLVYSNNKGDSE